MDINPVQNVAHQFLQEQPGCQSHVSAQAPGERFGQQLQVGVVSDRVDAPGVRDTVRIEVPDFPPDLNQLTQIEVPEAHLGRPGTVKAGIGPEVHMQALRQRR